MQVYKTPIREYRFLLEDFLKLNSSKVLTDRSLEVDGNTISRTIDFCHMGSPAVLSNVHRLYYRYDNL